MILTCPACQTRYRADDASIGAAGRDVRCAKCGHTWHYSREATAETAPRPPAAPATTGAAEKAFPAPASDAASAPKVDAPKEAGAPAPTPAVPAEPAAPPEPAVASPRRGVAAGLGWAALILVVAALVLVAILARDKIIAMWPPAARIYAFANLGGEPAGAGLEIKVSPSRTADSLVIDGDITNSAGTARTVPRLRVALRDANKNELDSKVIDPPVERLLPGAVAHFTTNFPNPNPNAAGVAVTFATN